MRSLSTVMNFILIPALTISALGGGLSVELLTDGGWILAVIGCLSSWAFACVGFALRPLARPDPAFARLFVVMSAIPNIVAIPLTIMESLCGLGVFDDEFHARSECVARVRAYVFLYISLDSINTFVVAQTYLASDDRSRTGSTTQAAVEVTSASPTSLELQAKEGVAGDPADGDCKATAAASAPTAVMPTRKTPVDFAGKECRALFKRPPVVAMVCGMAVALIDPIRRALFGRGDEAVLEVVGFTLHSLGQAGVPTINLMVAFSLGHKLRALTSWRDLCGSPTAGLSRRTMLVLTSGRMLIVPAIDCLVLYAMLPLLPASRAFRVLLFVEMAPPTASIVVLLAHLAEQPKLAQLAAFALVPQYLVGTISLTAVVAVALWIA